MSKHDFMYLLRMAEEFLLHLGHNIGQCLHHGATYPMIRVIFASPTSCHLPVGWAFMMGSVG